MVWRRPNRRRFAEVMAIPDDPAYAAFFGSHARAEVPIVGQIGDGIWRWW